MLWLPTLEGTITLPLSTPTKTFGLVDKEIEEEVEEVVEAAGDGMMVLDGLIPTGVQMNPIILMMEKTA